MPQTLTPINSVPSAKRKIHALDALPFLSRGGITVFMCVLRAFPSIGLHEKHVRAATRRCVGFDNDHFHAGAPQVQAEKVIPGPIKLGLDKVTLPM